MTGSVAETMAPKMRHSRSERGAVKPVSTCATQQRVDGQKAYHKVREKSEGLGQLTYSRAMPWHTAAVIRVPRNAKVKMLLRLEKKIR